MTSSATVSTPSLAQTAVHRHRIWAGVDHDGLAVGQGQHERVALADIAGDHHRTGGRPAGRDHRSGTAPTAIASDATRT